MNSVNLIGNLTRDPELRHTPSGTPVCNMRIAVNDRRKQGDEWVDVPYYFNITVWGRTGENCAQYLVKGQKIGVHGKLTWREWESDGATRQAVEVEVGMGGSVDFLTKPNDNGGAPRERATAAVGQQTGFPDDDDIPF